MAKGPIYEVEGSICNPKLLDQLKEAMFDLEVKMKATVPIRKGSHPVWFGVDKVQREIAADAVISIAKAIKALKGW
jgi:hypothetical protein